MQIYTVSQSSTPANPASGLIYRLAGQELWVGEEIPELAPFQQSDRPVAVTTASSAPAEHNDEEITLIYRGPGWIAGQTRHFQLAERRNDYRLLIDGMGEFSISKDGDRIRSLSAGSRQPAVRLTEAILGPALILALALKGTWCLHAGSVLVENRAVAFLGESGRGKSTLAGFLGNSAEPIWPRISDDVLPVSRLAEGIRALPHFPQLKLASEEQPVHTAPEQLAVKAVYVLADAPDPAQPVRASPLPLAQAVLFLARNTIAARLFTKDLLASHLDFCQEMAQAVPVRVLSYPHDCERLGEVQGALAADLAQLN